jgi:molybdate/tungstate transport system permease protein
VRRQHTAFTAGLATLGALLVLVVVLPVLSTLLGVSPTALWQALMDVQVLRSLTLTFYCAAVATLVALVTGVPLAYLLARHRFPGKWLLEGIIDLPVVIPHTAAGIALLMVFGQRGWLGQPLTAVGILFTERAAGVVVAMLFVSLPFLVNAAREAFALVDVELELVALVEGASPLQAFWLVTLPLARRGVSSGALLMWARGISEFGAVAILAYNPKIIPVLVWERFQGFGLAAAKPVAALLILTSLVVFVLLRLVAGRSRV